ncbi:MAG: hypothetical protein PHN82_10970 [bacterium]|nr:hypothetical protein [bacterium]
MKTLILVACVAAVAAAVQPAAAENPVAASRCEACGKLIGREVRGTELSEDPDFKQNGMFQVCQECLDGKMNREAQASLTQLAMRYKWNSIAHNKGLAFKPLRRPGR